MNEVYQMKDGETLEGINLTQYSEIRMVKNCTIKNCQLGATEIAGFDEGGCLIILCTIDDFSQIEGWDDHEGWELLINCRSFKAMDKGERDVQDQRTKRIRTVYH